MAERLGNLGYLALKKETTKGVAVVPDDSIPLYDEGLSTALNLIENNPVVGNKFQRVMVLQGQRNHGGEFTVLAEPNTTGKLWDMALTKGTSSSVAPGTLHPYTLSANTNPNSYTVDISTGNQVIRFTGCEASSIKPAFEDNEMRWVVKIAALKAFYGREIASIATNVVTLSTAYDPIPTNCLVTGDLVRIVRAADGVVQDFVITSLTSTTVTLSGSPSGMAAGDTFVLRPQTVGQALRSPFKWSDCKFQFAATAAAALTAPQLRVEQGSEFEVMHNFESDEGAKRSGDLDPDSLVRTQGDVSLKIKRFFDTPDELRRFTSVSKWAMVLRIYSENGYEFRLTLNNLKLRDGGKPMVKSAEILYYELDFAPMIDTADGQAFDVKVLNALATI